MKIDRTLRVLVVSALVAAPVLLVAGPADAATGVFRSGSTLVVNAIPNRANNITVNHSGNTLFVTDLGDSVSPGAGCLPVGGNSVACSATGVTLIRVRSGDLNDRVIKNSPIPATIDTETGNDVITIGPQPATGANNLFGGEGIDTLNGGPGPDMLFGGPGNDVMNGAGGNDVASAGVSGDGRDVFSGGTGTDGVTYFLRGLSVRVTVDGVANDGELGEGDNNRADVENITGGPASDILTGNASNNVITGGFGNDILNGLGGADVISGQSGADTLNGGAGSDRLDGGQHNDTLLGGDDTDSLSGGPGPIDDVDGLISDRDVIDGGPGIDTVDYAARTVRVIVDLDGVADDGVATENDNVRADVENVVSGSGDDTLTGNELANRLIALGGNDRLIGAGGADVLTGGSGADSMHGGNGNDVLNGIDFVSGNDTLTAGSGTDTCSSDSGDVESACEN